jgi:putative flippase GtrA
MLHQPESQAEPSSSLKSQETPAGVAVRQGSLCGQILRFGVAGVIGFVVNAGIVGGLAHSIGPILAQVLAFPVAATVTWWLNRRYTFGASQQEWHREWLRYVTANALGWSTNNGVYFLLILQSALMYKHPTLAVATSSLMGMFFNFAISKWVVFK